jgi:hypothetical protein
MYHFNQAEIVVLFVLAAVVSCYAALPADRSLTRYYFKEKQQREGHNKYPLLFNNCMISFS